MKGVLHGGSGRIGKISMRTMSLYESGKSSGAIGLLDLFEHKLTPSVTDEVNLDMIIDYIIRGGWPGIQNLPQENALVIPKDYLKNIPDDMYRMDGIKRNNRKVSALIRALGRAESTMTSLKTLQKYMMEFPEDTEEPSNTSISTINDYLDCFSRLFLIEDQPFFDVKLRSSVKALKKPKRHFTDPSLAAAAINATPKKLKNDLNTLGYLFEALCIRDLRIYSGIYDGYVYHYHDERDNEADAIIDLPDGRWGMIEIKIGYNQVDAAADNLISLKSKFQAETGSKPEFLAVICGMANAAYQRADGVYVKF